MVVVVVVDGKCANAEKEETPRLPQVVRKERTVKKKKKKKKKAK